MNTIKSWAVAALITLLPVAASAQLVSFQPGTGRVEAKKVKKAQKTTEQTTSNAVETTVGADIVSHYIWRGQDLAGFSIQPSASVGWKGLSLTAAGSASLDRDDYQEIDLTLGYKLGHFNIGVSDYWCTGIDTENRYMYYDVNYGAHKFEGNLGFTCKYFSLQGYCIFWGNDFKLDGSRAYSTYIELGVPFKFGSLDWLVTAGMTPMESAGQWEEQTRMTELGEHEVNVRVWDYAEGPACCHAAIRCTKELNLGSMRMPVFAEMNMNPYLSKANLIFGVSINVR